MRLNRSMWLLLVAIIVLVKKTINIYQMVGDEIKAGHILIFCCFAVPVHFRQVLKCGEIALGQEQICCQVIAQKQYGSQSSQLNILDD